MTRPSKAAAVFLVLFGMVFVAGGLFFAWALLFGPTGSVHGSKAALVVVSLVFVAVGGGLAISAIYGTRKFGEQAALAQSNPDSPWLWRKDWADSRAYGNNSRKAVGLAAFAAFWNTIAITASAAALPQYLRSHDAKFLMPLIFVAVGGVLTFFAARAGMRRERFGQTYFQFASLPFSPGKTLSGTIHLRFNASAKHGINARLSCVRQMVSGVGENRSKTEVVLWQSDKNISEQSITPGPMGDAAIPVDFAIPSDGYETSHDQYNDQLLWILHAEADIPGVNFSDDFEVPVFRLTLQTASSFGDAASAMAPAGFQSDSEDVPPPDNPKVVVGAGANGGTEFYFPPFRNAVRLLGLILFTAIWTGLVYLLAHSQAPVFFTAIFGLFELILIVGVLRSAMGSWRIEAGNGKVVLSRAYLGIGSSREIPYSEIAQILATSMAVQASQTFYSLRLQTKSGQRITLADAIDNRQEARWVTAQLQKLVGLKLDTHVAVDGPSFGGYGAPPQRGMAAPQSTTWARVALALGIAVLCALMGFVFFLRSSVKSGQSRPRTTRRVAQTTSPFQAVNYSSTLTDNDVRRLQGMTEQAQAEELLERSIRHDTRALDMFEQNIGIWLGDIKLSERMKQLEWRSRFSTDLRVRYANADLNLAMDGWPKSDNSVDLLIAKADSDAKYRESAVYFMGMMAGRGVGYDRIYPVLVEHARNNPDANVRQWAIEGMRYLGTDEALDVLFQSFTQDPADAVRNRAGCNISDCGNFMRKQRMRMVPKFIELVEDPQTKPAMRSWSFMALREITDEGLPADASAWRDWYTQHGAEKMAEFEQMDWWKVRGDE
jgi:HEAT repeats